MAQAGPGTFHGGPWNVPGRGPGKFQVGPERPRWPPETIQWPGWVALGRPTGRPWNVPGDLFPPSSASSSPSSSMSSSFCSSSSCSSSLWSHKQKVRIGKGLGDSPLSHSASRDGREARGTRYHTTGRHGNGGVHGGAVGISVSSMAPPESPRRWNIRPQWEKKALEVLSSAASSQHRQASYNSILCLFALLFRSSFEAVASVTNIILCNSSLEASITL